MCDQSVYLKKNNEEVLVMEAAQSIEVFEGGIRVSDIFGQEKVMTGSFVRWADNRVVFEATE